MGLYQVYLVRTADGEIVRLFEVGCANDQDAALEGARLRGAAEVEIEVSERTRFVCWHFFVASARRHLSVAVELRTRSKRSGSKCMAVFSARQRAATNVGAIRRLPVVAPEISNSAQPDRQVGATGSFSTGQTSRREQCH
jgi:hypothetical protein